MFIKRGTHYVRRQLPLLIVVRYSFRSSCASFTKYIFKLIFHAYDHFFRLSVKNCIYSKPNVYSSYETETFSRNLQKYSLRCVYGSNFQYLPQMVPNGIESKRVITRKRFYMQRVYCMGLNTNLVSFHD